MTDERQPPHNQEPRGPQDMSDRLDHALTQWAHHDPGENAAVARILQHADALTASPAEAHPSAPHPSGRGRGWMAYAMGGGAIAASIAIALLVTPAIDAPGGASGTAPPQTMAGATQEQGRMELAAADREVDSFAMLFTLTAEEEQYL